MNGTIYLLYISRWKTRKRRVRCPSKGDPVACSYRTFLSSTNFRGDRRRDSTCALLNHDSGTEGFGRMRRTLCAGCSTASANRCVQGTSPGSYCYIGSRDDHRYHFLEHAGHLCRFRPGLVISSNCPACLTAPERTSRRSSEVLTIRIHEIGCSYCKCWYQYQRVESETRWNPARLPNLRSTGMMTIAHGSCKQTRKKNCR